MGGRGTYASGNNVAYTYETVGTIEGVKVLQPIDHQRSFNMPPEAHSSSKYIILGKNGVFRQYVEYDSNHLPIFEIGYHFEKGLSKNGAPAFHVHEYTSPGIDFRLPARAITASEYEKYKKYFRGVK